MAVGGIILITVGDSSLREPILAQNSKSVNVQPRLILVILAIVLAALSYWLPQTLGAAVILLGAALLVPAGQ